MKFCCPHNEILRNLLTSKTGYVEIALRLGFGINLVCIVTYVLLCLAALYLFPIYTSQTQTSCISKTVSTFFCFTVFLDYIYGISSHPLENHRCPISWIFFRPILGGCYMFNVWNCTHSFGDMVFLCTISVRVYPGFSLMQTRMKLE
jgi:hypothetical protein